MMLWASSVWSDRKTAGITIKLVSDVGDLVKFGCRGGREPSFTLSLAISPYQLKSTFASHMINSKISFPNQGSISGVAHINLQRGSALFLLTQQQSKRFRSELANSNERFTVNWTSAVPLKSGLEDKERAAKTVLNALKAQGPLVINAPNETHGPIKNLLGVYHQACLGEVNGKPVLRVASGWLYDAGALAKSWVAPRLRYGGELQIDCMVIGSKKSGFVTLARHPYSYLNAATKSLTFTFPSGAEYRMTAKADRKNWDLKAHLDVASVRRLVQRLRSDRGDMKVAWDNKYISVPLTANPSDLTDFLAKCN